MNWIFTAGFSGDVLAGRDFAKLQNLKIVLEPGGEGRDPIKLVRDNEFGVASADEILRAIDKGADIVMVGILQDEHPAGFAALEASGIRTPRDFEGKRVGLLPFGATGLIYQAMVVSAGIDRKKINEVVVSPDLRPFISGQVVDVQPIFMFDEPVSLDKLGIKYVIIDPRTYNVRFKGQAYFTTRQTVAANPALVRRFLSATIAGWEAAAKDPTAAIQAIKEKAPSIDVERERELLRRGIGFFVAPPRRVLDTDLKTWDGMVKTLIQTGAITKPVDLDKAIDLSALKAAYAQAKN